MKFAVATKHTYTNKKGKKQDLDINVIPNNMEKYMAFMLRKRLKFIDSFQFMSTSLDKLVSNLPKEDLKYTSEEFTGDKLSLMSQKVIWIALKNSTKWNYQLRMNSLAPSMTNILQIGNTTMQGKFGKPSA